MSIFWENTSCYVVFSASRFDSGYMLLPVYVVVGTVSVYSAMLVLSGTCYASVYGVQDFHVSRVST